MNPLIASIIQKKSVITKIVVRTKDAFSKRCSGGCLNLNNASDSHELMAFRTPIMFTVQLFQRCK
ncbi:unnamed protein product [Sphenostylis stenocarpa]|uniref:Uncharacterized protein n=1 Tax=Sphenostylis stenocarpa TaxID=92480 RepID=A0AA86T673_9FABA|nr:unnamed protein product [Sphenostylis stenocarpa]